MFSATFGLFLQYFHVFLSFLPVFQAFTCHICIYWQNSLAEQLSTVTWQDRIEELGPPLTGKNVGRKGLNFGRTKWLAPLWKWPSYAYDFGPYIYFVGCVVVIRNIFKCRRLYNCSQAHQTCYNIHTTHLTRSSFIVKSIIISTLLPDLKDRMGSTRSQALAEQR